MSARCPPGVDLRAFRWPLQPLERKLDSGLEAARLALASLQREARSLDDALAGWQAWQQQQQRAAADSIRRDPRLAPHALGFLAAVHERLQVATAACAEVDERLARARAECVERQRRLACVQALRERAQQVHAAGQLRREAREADAAWLVRSEQRRVAARGAAG